MQIRFLKNADKKHKLILFFLMLISCKIHALHTTSDNDFSLFLKRVELINNQNPQAALKLLNDYPADISSQLLNSQVSYYNILSAAYADQSLFTQSEITASKGLALAKQMSNPSILIAELAYTKGYALESLGYLERATLHYQNGLEVAKSMGDDEFIGKGLTNIGAIFYLKQDYEQSLIVLNQALKLANEIASDELKGNITSELGILYGYIGQEEQAAIFFEQSYQHFTNIGLHYYALNSLHNLAINHANLFKFEQAVEVYQVLVEETKKSSDNDFIASVYRGFSWALLKKKQPDKDRAYHYISLAGEYVKEAEQHESQLLYLIDKAFVLREIERFDEALITVKQAETLLSVKLTDTASNSQINILYLKAKLHYALENYQHAYIFQSEYYQAKLAANDSLESTTIDELRLKYETEQVELQNNILQKKQTVQNFLLTDAKDKANNRQVFLAGLAIILLTLAWFLAKIIKGQKRLLLASQTDSLTGVANRRRLMDVAQKYFLTAQKKREKLSVLVIDVDHFKQINDNFGHKSGDAVLRKLAVHGQSLMRGSDIFGRFGGEEFIVILPDTGLTAATEIAQRLRKTIENYQWNISGIEELTISVGVATFSSGNFPTFKQLLKAADVMLFNAKKFGRNQVCYEQ